MIRSQRMIQTSLLRIARQDINCSRKNLVKLMKLADDVIIQLSFVTFFDDFQLNMICELLKNLKA